MHSIEEDLEVYVSPAGQVCVARRDMNEDCCVAIPAGDVDILIGWLREKQAEALGLQRGLSTEVASVD